MRRPLLLAGFLVGLLALVGVGSARRARADDAPTAAPSLGPPVLSRFGEGDGPTANAGVLRLLDAAKTPLQSNAVAFERVRVGASRTTRITATLRMEEGGDGGAFLLLDTAAYGTRGPAPFVPSWTDPNLRHAFAVGLDVHDPPNRDVFTKFGNYEGLPEREVSLHWDGREVAKRVAPEEFRGRDVPLRIDVTHVPGGADVTVEVAGAAVFERFYVAGLLPGERRLAIGAGTRADATTRFDVSDLRFAEEGVAPPARPPLHVEVFDHVRTGGTVTSHVRELVLPPAAWAFARVLLTLDLHDAGEAWDEWDRNGEVSVVAEDGTRHGIVPFITSYRTPCHWVVDVTDFRPWLSGRCRIELEAGTNFYKGRGFLASVALDFVHGVPDLEPFRVLPLWVGTARHGARENHYRDFFPPKAVAIDPAATAARVFVTATGHTPVGEFTPSTRTLVFAPRRGGPADAERRFESPLWRRDVYLNPNRPQFGTWQFARAGWAPGDVVHPWWIDVSSSLVPGVEAELRYEPGPYEFPAGEPPPEEDAIAQAVQVVRSYLVLYRPPGDLVRAPTLRITGVDGGSPAAQAGVVAGDHLAAYDGVELDTVDALRAAISAAKDAGKERVPVVLWHAGARVETTLPTGRLGVQFAGP